MTCAKVSVRWTAAAMMLAAPLGGGALAETMPATGAVGCPAGGKHQIWVDALKTCIDPGGYLWAEGYYNEYTDYPADADRFYGIGTLGLTLNTTTDTGPLGPLRGVADVRFQYRSADAFAGGPPELQVKPQTLYIDWSGLTVGFRHSFFDFYKNANVMGTDPAITGDSTKLPVAAYTLAMREGWSATIAAEQGNYRGGGIAAADAYSGAVFGQDSRTPDFVAALGQKAEWGKFQVSGALHRVAVNGDVPWMTSSPETWGYALQAGVMVNLPMITEGDSLYFQTAYVDGATSYLGLVNPSGDFTPPDAYLGFGGSLSRVTGWNVTAQYLHNWSPVLNSALFAGYGRFDLNDATAQLTYGASGGNNFNAGANVVWSATKDLSFLAQYAFNYYGARDYVNTSNGLPQSSQSAHEVLLMARYGF